MRKAEVGNRRGIDKALPPCCLYWFFLVSAVIVAVCNHARTSEIVHCDPSRENESAPRAENVRNLLFRLVGGTPDDFVDKVMRYRRPTVFYAPNERGTALCPRDLRSLYARKRDTSRRFVFATINLHDSCDFRTPLLAQLANFSFATPCLVSMRPCTRAALSVDSSIRWPTPLSASINVMVDRGVGQ